MGNNSCVTILFLVCRLKQFMECNLFVMDSIWCLKVSNGSMQRPRCLNEVTCSRGEPSLKELVRSGLLPRPNLELNNIQQDFFLFSNSLFDNNQFWTAENSHSRDPLIIDVLLPDAYITMSSTYKCIWQLELIFGMSLIKMEKRSSPRDEPCGTPFYTIM